MGKKIIYKKLDDIIPYANNPRENKEAIDYVASSISEYGFQNPIIIDKDNIIVCGHTRKLAAEKLGLKEVPCIIADELTKEQIKGFRLVDNKVSEFSEWDFDKLDIELGEMPNFSIDKFGFEISSSDLLDDEPKENKKESQTIDCPQCGFTIEV